MICPNCGKEIEDNGKFCGYCGYKLVQDATPVTHKREPVKNTKKPNKKTIAIALVVVAIIGGALFVKNKKSSYAFGTDKANKIFTEHTGRTQQLNERETLVENAIIEAVNRLECCTRRDIINNVPIDQLKIYSFKPWEINETQYKRRVAEQIFRDIIEAVKLKYGLEYKRLNAEEKKKYNKTDSKWYVYRKE